MYIPGVISSAIPFSHTLWMRTTGNVKFMALVVKATTSTFRSGNKTRDRYEYINWKSLHVTFNGTLNWTLFAHKSQIDYLIYITCGAFNIMLGECTRLHFPRRHFEKVMKLMLITWKFTLSACDSFVFSVCESQTRNFALLILRVEAWRIRLLVER